MEGLLRDSVLIKDLIPTNVTDLNELNSGCLSIITVDKVEQVANLPVQEAVSVYCIGRKDGYRLQIAITGDDRKAFVRSFIYTVWQRWKEL